MPTLRVWQNAIAGLPRHPGVVDMAVKQHALSIADAETMAATRAYLATLPKMGITPEARGGFDEFMASTPAASGIRFEPGTIAGAGGWWCIPDDPRSDTALIHFHGGGYVVGSAQAYRNFVSHLARQAEVSTFVPDYALAPEQPFPAAFDQAMAIVQTLHDGGRTNLAVSGDSAGGGLALAAAQAGVVSGPALRGIVLMSPWTDLTLTASSLSERAEADPVLTREAADGAAELYVGTGSRRDPRVSPRFGSFAGLPPVMVHVGADEVLLDDALSTGDNAEAAGVAAEVHVWEGMTHVFPASLATLHAAREAMELSAAFLRDQWAGLVR
jgi:epsilon-lactone hydrolase